MRTTTQNYLERPVRLETAAKKVAKLRGHEGRDGGWIYNEHGYPVTQGWQSYGHLLLAAGIIGQDGNRYYVSVPWLSAKEYAEAERIYS
jgi:hypothetical protein